MKVDITGRNFEVEAKLRSYVEEKLGGLDKFIARSDQQAAHLAVVLEEDVSGREDNRFVCDAVLRLPKQQLVAREGTVNMFAAVDIVEAKLTSQLSKYKAKHHEAVRRGKLLSKWMGQTTE
jgi:putative sigma-54 modulation protein